MRRSTLLLLLFLPSCFSAKYCSDEIDLSRTDLDANIDAAIEMNTVERVDSIPEDWWTLFNDPQLNNLVEKALECNPTIEEAKYRIQLAYQIAVEARSKLLPSVNLFGAYEKDMFHVWEFALSGLSHTLNHLDNLFLTVVQGLVKASWEIDIWGKNRNDYLGKLDATTAKLADFLQAKLQLSTSICTAYFELQSYLEQYDLYARYVEDQQGIVDLMRQRFNSGMSSEFDLYQQDRLLATTVDELNIIKGKVETARHTLAALVGNSVSICGECAEVEVVPTAAYHGAFPIPKCLGLDLVARRPDIRANVWLISQAMRNVKVAKAAFFPNLNLSGDLGAASYTLSRIFKLRQWEFDGEAQSTLPLYTGGQLPSQLGQARINLEIAVQQYNQSVLKAVEDVSNALSDLTTADQRKVDIRRAVDDAKYLDGLTTQKFQHGIETYVSVLSSRTNVVSQEVTAAQVHLKRMQAMVDLIRSVGGGFYDGRE